MKQAKVFFLLVPFTDSYTPQGGTELSPPQGGGGLKRVPHSENSTLFRCFLVRRVENYISRRSCKRLR